MIIDSHTHAWERWPYQPAVPDGESRGRREQLIHEMDQHDIQKAVIISAQIDHNPANNEYVAQQVRTYPDRLIQFADIDSFWSASYHTAGAADRLIDAAARWPIDGFTHYLRADDPGDWLTSKEGDSFFEAAAERNLIASIACHPHQQPAIREAARRAPTVPVLCHHLSGLKAGQESTESDLAEVTASASVANIFIKVSGFAYCSQREWDYPYSDTMWILRTLYENFGAHRMCWGSDYPVVRFFMTYRQALEAVRKHASFIPEGDKDAILGGTLGRLLAKRVSDT